MVMLKNGLFGCIVLSLSITVHALTPITVMLDWLPNPNQAPLFLALDTGIFAKHGLNVTLINPSDASDPLKMVAVAKVDIALSYQPSWLLMQARGLPVAWIGTLIDQPLACVIADKSQDIQKFSDLNHKTIGYSSGVVDSLMINAMLAYHHMPLDSVQLLNVHYNLNPALLAHRVAAISGAMRNVELVELQQQHFPVTVFYPEQNGVPPYAELIFVAKKIAVQAPTSKAFMAAISEAILQLKAHPDTHWQVIIKHHPELNTPINRRIYQVTLPYFTDRPDYFDNVQNARLAQFLNVKVGV